MFKVAEVDGFDMVRTMAAEVQIMMQHKIDAIKRIMELAENIALDHKYDKVIVWIALALQCDYQQPAV